MLAIDPCDVGQPDEQRHQQKEEHERELDGRLATLYTARYFLLPGVAAH
jgi:hypothetical protein